MMHGSEALQSGPAALLMGLGIVAMTWMMMGHAHRHDHVQGNDSHTGDACRHTSGEDEHVLAERLARGEVDIDEYERHLLALRRTNELDQTWEMAP